MPHPQADLRGRTAEIAAARYIPGVKSTNAPINAPIDLPDDFGLDDDGDQGHAGTSIAVTLFISIVIAAVLLIGALS